MALTGYEGKKVISIEMTWVKLLIGIVVNGFILGGFFERLSNEQAALKTSVGGISTQVSAVKDDTQSLKGRVLVLEDRSSTIPRIEKSIGELERIAYELAGRMQTSRLAERKP